MPPVFAGYAERGEDWAGWLDRLPGVVREVLDDWELAPDGGAVHGYGALVLPVRTTSGRPAVLKVTYPHPEAEHEHLALQAWQGAGAVRLLRADPHRWALLLERLHPDEDLTGLEDLAACEVVAGLYRRLHVPALPQLRTLSSYVACWTERLHRLPADAPLPRRLVDQAASLGRAFVTDPATDGTMIHADLHYQNVLAGDREPWLAIDPKPVSGDPHYEPAPLLWNRWEEMVSSGSSARDGIRRRFFTVVDAAELEEDRSRDWVVVREMHNALWTLEDADRLGRSLTATEQDSITVAITIAKAVQG